MLKKSLYLLLILSANGFLFAEQNENQGVMSAGSAGIDIDSGKIHGVQEMYFIPKGGEGHRSQYHEQFGAYQDIIFDN